MLTVLSGVSHRGYYHPYSGLVVKRGNIPIASYANSVTGEWHVIHGLWLDKGVIGFVADGLLLPVVPYPEGSYCAWQKNTKLARTSV